MSCVQSCIWRRVALACLACRITIANAKPSKYFYSVLFLHLQSRNLYINVCFMCTTKLYTVYNCYCCCLKCSKMLDVITLDSKKLEKGSWYFLMAITQKLIVMKFEWQISALSMVCWCTVLVFVLGWYQSNSTSLLRRTWTFFGCYVYNDHLAIKCTELWDYKNCSECSSSNHNWPHCQSLTNK